MKISISDDLQTKREEGSRKFWTWRDALHAVCKEAQKMGPRGTRDLVAGFGDKFWIFCISFNGGKCTIWQE